MKRKRWSLLLAAVLTVSMLAGCGGTKEAGNSEGEGAAGAAGGKVLTAWLEKSFSEDANAVLKDRIEQFAQEKNVDVQFEFLAATDFVPKLNAAIEANTNIPDIILTTGNRALNYYPNIPQSDVTALVDEIHAERPYFDAIYEGAKYGGVNYFVPFYSSSSLMFLRTDILEKNGITEYPTTWDEVFEVAEKVSDPANGIYGLGVGCGPTDEDCENTFRTILWNYGGYLFHEDGTGNADNEIAKELIQKYTELYEKEVIPPSATTWDPGGNNTTYLMGESAMVFNTPTLYNALKDDPAYEEILKNTVAINLPAGPENSTRMGFLMGFSIMESCQDKETAGEFIKYMLDKDWYGTYFELTAPVFAPVFQDIEEDPFWSEGINAQVVEYAKNANGYYGYPSESLEGMVVGVKHYFTYPVAEMLNSVVTGAATIDEATSKMNADIAAISKTLQQ